MSQSSHAATPSMIGAPEPAGMVCSEANLSWVAPKNVRHTSSWSALRMFTQKLPALCIFGQLVEVRAGKNAMSGGSSETEVNDPTTMPHLPCSGLSAVMTQTPVGYCPRTRRYVSGSILSDSQSIVVMVFALQSWPASPSTLGFRAVPYVLPGGTSCPSLWDRRPSP